MIPVTSGMGAASALRPCRSSELAAGFVMPVLSAGASFAIGKAFIQHFESGGTLLDFNPPDYREFVKAQKEMWDSRPRKRSDTTGAATRPRDSPELPASDEEHFHQDAKIVKRRDRSPEFHGCRHSRLHNCVPAHGSGTHRRIGFWAALPRAVTRIGGVDRAVHHRPIAASHGAAAT